MKEKFEIKFLGAATLFVVELPPKAKTKLIYNIRRAKQKNDPAVFKKLDDAIWEFRVKSMGLQYRLPAFWDKRDNTKTLVVCTHGFIKKSDRVAPGEINRAWQIMNKYFLQQNDEEKNEDIHLR